MNINIDRILLKKIGIELSEPLKIATKSLSLQSARLFTHMIMSNYWVNVQPERCNKKLFRLRSCSVVKATHYKLLNKDAQTQAKKIGLALSEYTVVEASYLVGTIYTSLLPNDYRSKNGVYYTPPSLTKRLIDQATKAGIDWETARVLDPACGGGAFLAPVIERKLKAMSGSKPIEIVKSISKTICGYEIDIFSAWLTQVFVDIVTFDVCVRAGKRLPVLTKVKNSLEKMEKYPIFDLVIGNPPYSKIKLDKKEREQYQRSLYGHANLYSLFTDQALNFAKSGGVIAYVTPSSFLSGQYFKGLRSLLRSESPPYSIDFVSDRSGVFEDVLQETVLVTYRKSAKNKTGTVNLLKYNKDNVFRPQSLGRFRLPEDDSSPWLMPRTKEQADLMTQLPSINNRLSDYGYKVSTGPLVWNRHKDQLVSRKSKYAYPLIWAESIAANGVFVFKAEKRNHKPYFKWKSSRDKCLLVNKPCVLLQRTTSLEQERRLIAAELPAEFISQYGSVVVENHINMIVSTKDEPSVSVKTLTVLFNSKVMDQVFRCYNGSVAVSAYELAALPLPSIEIMEQLEDIVRFNPQSDLIEKILREVYFDEKISSAA